MHQSPQFNPVSLRKASFSERLTLLDPSGAVVEMPASMWPQWLAQLLPALRRQVMEMFREVYLHREPVDLRKAIDRLYSIVALEMKLVAFPGAMIVFCNHTCNQLKIIYWD